MRPPAPGVRHPRTSITSTTNPRKCLSWNPISLSRAWFSCSPPCSCPRCVPRATWSLRRSSRACTTCSATRPRGSSTSASPAPPSWACRFACWAVGLPTASTRRSWWWASSRCSRWRRHWALRWRTSTTSSRCASSPQVWHGRLRTPWPSQSSPTSSSTRSCTAWSWASMARRPRAWARCLPWSRACSPPTAAGRARLRRICSRSPYSCCSSSRCPACLRRPLRPLPQRRSPSPRRAGGSASCRWCARRSSSASATSCSFSCRRCMSRTPASATRPSRASSPRWWASPRAWARSSSVWPTCAWRRPSTCRRSLSWARASSWWRSSRRAWWRFLLPWSSDSRGRSTSRTWWCAARSLWRLTRPAAPRASSLWPTVRRLRSRRTRSRVRWRWRVPRAASQSGRSSASCSQRWASCRWRGTCVAPHPSVLADGLRYSDYTFRNTNDDLRASLLTHTAKADFNLKNKYCENNNLKIIRIPYLDLNVLNDQYLKSLL